jgi:RNA polymerase sigma factor for flagellar operon FliA
MINILLSTLAALAAAGLLYAVGVGFGVGLVLLAAVAFAGAYFGLARRTLKQLEAKFGRAPADAEVAEHMGLSREEFEKLLIEANAVGLVSLNKKWCETDSSKEVQEIDILEDKKGEDPTRRIQKADLMRLVTKGLNRNERLIIILYYYEELTMKEIGATLDLSESRVSQMHSAIVERLQGQLGRRKPEFAM